MSLAGGHTCGTCRFWAVDPDAHGNASVFDCRRHAPTYNGAYRTHWCKTSRSDWCGEWGARQ